VAGIVDRLLELALEKGALRYGEFTLTSGKKSSYYFDGRILSLDPEGAYLIAKAVMPVLVEAGVEALGGPTLGADPIVAAVALSSHLQEKPIPAFIVRKEAKSHGTGSVVEGHLERGSRVAIIDDTCTTGGSLFHAIETAEAAGCEVVKVLAVLDRMEGGSDALKKRGYDFSALMAASPDGQIGVVKQNQQGDFLVLARAEHLGQRGNHGGPVHEFQHGANSGMCLPHVSQPDYLAVRGDSSNGSH
jgi:orotate phosphoribosyltransferase